MVLQQRLVRYDLSLLLPLTHDLQLLVAFPAAAMAQDVLLAYKTAPPGQPMIGLDANPSLGSLLRAYT